MADLMGDFDEFSSRFRSLVAHYKKQFPSVEINEEAELAKFKVRTFFLNCLSNKIQLVYLHLYV